MDDLARYFDILELRHGASPEEIKRAYRDLVQIWHPDRYNHNPRLRSKAEEKLKSINEAYQCLSAYSRRSAAGTTPPPKSPPPENNAGPTAQNSRTQEKPPPQPQRPPPQTPPPATDKPQGSPTARKPNKTNSDFAITASVFLAIILSFVVLIAVLQRDRGTSSTQTPPPSGEPATPVVRSKSQSRALWRADLERRRQESEAKFAYLTDRFKRGLIPSQVESYNAEVNAAQRESVELTAEMKEFNLRSDAPSRYR